MRVLAPTIRHNPDIADGLDGLAQGFAALAEAGMAITYTEVHAIIAEGNFVFTMSEGTMGDTPTAYFDQFRLEGAHCNAPVCGSLLVCVALLNGEALCGARPRRLAR